MNAGENALRILRFDHPGRIVSCGKIDSMLETFMDLGVDILNPVQATANDLDEIRQLTQGRMALSGAVSTDTIVKGPVDAIVAEVRLRMWQLGRTGGYFCGPDQGMPFPETHWQAAVEAIEKYGNYPIERSPATGACAS